MAKKALLIGCNYPTTMAELRGCINDVWTMHSCLIDRYGFSEENITVLIDTDPSFTQPTGKNIRLALLKLVQSAEPGDELFVHFSGHGTRLLSLKPEEDDTGFDECIVPADFNLITDDDFKEYVVKVPTGCRLTIVADSCNSGGLIEAAKEQIGESTKKERSCFGFIMKSFDLFRTKPIEPHDIHDVEERDGELCYGHYSYVKSRSLPVSTLIDILKQKTGKDDIDLGNLRATLFDIFGEDASPKMKKFMKFGLDTLQDGGGESAGHGRSFKMVGMPEAYAVLTKSSLLDRGILLSACQSDQEAKEASLYRNSDIVYGVFSNAIQAIIEETDGAVTYWELVQKARKVLKGQGFTQKPGLYCSDNNVDARFLC